MTRTHHASNGRPSHLRRTIAIARRRRKGNRLRRADHETRDQKADNQHDLEHRRDELKGAAVADTAELDQ